MHSILIIHKCIVFTYTKHTNTTFISRNMKLKFMVEFNQKQKRIEI